MILVLITPKSKNVIVAIMKFTERDQKKRW
jgi:hypothetical protein